MGHLTFGSLCAALQLGESQSKLADQTQIASARSGNIKNYQNQRKSDKMKTYFIFHEQNHARKYHLLPQLE